MTFGRIVLKFRCRLRFELGGYAPSPSTPISRPSACQYFSMAGVESMIVPSMSKSKAAKECVSAGAEKALASWGGMVGCAERWSRGKM